MTIKQKILHDISKVEWFENKLKVWGNSLFDLVIQGSTLGSKALQ